MKKTFKRVTASLTAMLMMFGSTYTIIGAASATNNEIQSKGNWAMYGDVNNDGKIDMSDAVCIIMAVNKFNSFTGASQVPLEYVIAKPNVYFGEGDYIPQAADLNGDSYLTEEDSMMIQRYLLELPDIGRCGQPFFINE